MSNDTETVTEPATALDAADLGVDQTADAAAAEGADPEATNGAAEPEAAPAGISIEPAGKPASKQVRARVTKTAKAAQIGPVVPREKSEILMALACGEKCQIVFSDGNSEIAEIPGVTVDCTAFVQTSRGLKFVPPIEITGPAVGQPALALSGYGLIVDGQQIAWSERDPLAIPAGTTVRVSDDIFF